MSCKGCSSRKARLQTWIRRLLGIDEIITKQGEYFVKYVQSTASDLRQSSDAAHAKITQLVEAGSDLESAFALMATSNGARSSDADAKTEAIRGIIRNEKAELRKLADEVKDLNEEMSEFSSRLSKVEFPGFEPVAPKT